MPPPGEPRRPASAPRDASGLLFYERRTQPLLSRRQFARRLVLHAGVALAILAGALLVGVLGYRGLGRLPWIDAILNASMILSGMGPVAELESDGAKLFASVYALFSGVVFLAVTGLVLAPVLHRLLHRLHLDDGDD
jgi:hypothetical protein